jgi:hypothetical protein
MREDVPVLTMSVLTGDGFDGWLDWLRKLVIRAMAKRPFFNLELHGIDLSDAIADLIPTELAGRQPDLRVPYAVKRERFRQCIDDLREHFEFVTMREAATRFQREGML